MNPISNPDRTACNANAVESYREMTSEELLEIVISRSEAIDKVWSMDEDEPLEIQFAQSGEIIPINEDDRTMALDIVSRYGFRFVHQPNAQSLGVIAAAMRLLAET